MSGWKDRWTGNGWMDGRMETWMMSGWMCGCRGEKVDGRMDGRTGVCKQVNGLIDRRMGG